MVLRINSGVNLQEGHIFKDKPINILDGLSIQRVIRRINKVIQDYDPSGKINKIFKEKPYLDYSTDGNMYHLV